MTLHPCPQCGRETSAKVCQKCKSVAFHNLGLPPGDWVLRGNRRVFVPSEKWNRNQTKGAYVLDTIARNLAKTPPEPAPPAALCHCGCLLTSPVEPCPACHVIHRFSIDPVDNVATRPRQIHAAAGRIEAPSEGAETPSRGLIHSLDAAKEGLGMKPTQTLYPTATESEVA